jgi:hypothetical protein
MAGCVQPIGDPRPTHLRVESIRTDGGTQGRLGLNALVVREYAALMKAGVIFPPVRVWFDGSVYWLTDGFHRLAATVGLEREEISSEVFHGTLSEARWDSCAANSTHGLRRSRQDLEAVIRRALTHETGLTFSNNQIAKHLGIPEATIRRWRKRISSSTGEDRRVAIRKGTAYPISTKRIGKPTTVQSPALPKKRDLTEGLCEMKRLASPEARRVFNILGNWLYGRSGTSNCLFAVERLVGEWRSVAATPFSPRYAGTLTKQDSTRSPREMSLPRDNDAPGSS